MDSDSPNVWDFNTEGKRPGSWWWWFWLFFWDNPQDPGKPKQLMILWSTKNDPKIMCNKLLVDNHFIDKKDSSCEFGGTVGAWYYDGRELVDEYVLGKSNMRIQEKPNKRLTSDKPIETTFTEPQEGVFEVTLGDRLKFTAKSIDDDFSRLSYRKGVFFGMFDYRMTRMARLSLQVKEKGSEKTAQGTAYFQKVMVNAPVPPWHWGIFHFKDYSLTYYRPYIGSGLLSKNLFKNDPLHINKGLKSSIRFHDHRKNQTIVFNDITVKTKHAPDGLPVFEISSSDPKEGKIRFTVETYAEAVWKFQKRIANKLFNSNVHYQEYPSRITSLELETPERRLTIEDTGVGVGNAEDNAGFLV
jgi:hypothetical protein